MEITFQLKDDEGNTVGDERNADFNDNAKLGELKEMVNSLFNIDLHNQILYFDNKPIHTIPKETPLTSIGLHNTSVVEVKHSSLKHYTNYDLFATKTLNDAKHKTDNAKKALNLYEILNKNAFFVAYPEFEEKWIEKHHEVVAYTDGILEFMAKAAKNHFFLQHVKNGGDINNFEFQFQPRSEEFFGTRAAIIVTVKMINDEKATMYQIKTHQYGSSKSSTGSGTAPDIKEFFIYKLLDLIHVGPAAQFVFHTVERGTRKASYIATEWREDFHNIANLLKREEDIEKGALIEILLLHVLFSIKDLNINNCGIWNFSKRAAIVDFQIDNSLYNASNIEPSDLLKFFCENHFPNLIWPVEVKIVLFSTCVEQRKHVAKEVMKKWNLRENLENTYELIMKERDIMKSKDFLEIKTGLKFEVTDDLKEYFELLRTIVNKMMNALNIS